MITAALLVALAQDTIDNPEFKGWASFKPGSFVTYKYSPQDGGQKVTLKSVDENEAVVETVTTYNGKTGNAVERKVPAKLPAAQAPKDVKDGEDEIEAGGKKLKCRTRESDKKLASGKTVTIKIWIHDDVPGKGVQIQTTTETGKFTMVATEWEKK